MRVLSILPVGYVSWYRPSQACMCVWCPAIAGCWQLVPRYYGILVAGPPLLWDVGVWHLAIAGYWCLVPHLEVGCYCSGLGFEPDVFHRGTDTQ